MMSQKIMKIPNKHPLNENTNVRILTYAMLGDLTHYAQRRSLPIGKLNPNFIPDNNLLV